MQTKKRAKAVKFGKKIEKPASVEREVVNSEPVIEEKEVREHPHKQIDHTQKESEPEDKNIIQEEESRITEIKQTEIKEVTIETKQDLSQEPPPPQKEISSEDLAGAGEEEKQEEILKVETNDNYVVETKVKKNFLGYFMLISIISFIVGLLSMAGINFLNQQNQSSNNQKNTASVSVTQKVLPTNTPTPETVDLTKYNIRILNGSGVIGAAAKLKESLTSQGFTVTITGNAINNNFANTTISAKKDINPKYLEKLKSILGEDYTLATDSADTSSISTGEIDVTIIIGKN